MAILATLAIAALAPQPAGAAHVYWSTVGAGFEAIGRASLGGADVDQEFIKLDLRPPDYIYPGSVGDVVIAGRHLYWDHYRNDYYPSAVGRARLDGSGLDGYFVRAPGVARIAVGGSYIYWGDTRTGKIGRSTLSGAHITEDFIKADPSSLTSNDQEAPSGVAADTRYLYWGWASAGFIGRAKLNGTNVKHDFITGASASGLAVDARHIYWADRGAGKIGRADIDGRNVDANFIDAGAEPGDVAVGDDYIYWINDCCVGRANVDGSHVVTNLISRVGYSRGVAVDRAPDTGINSATKKLTSSGEPIPGRREQRQPRDEWRLKFRFSSSQPDSTFRCSFDGSVYRRCTSPKVYGEVTAGTHVFRVKARGLQGTDRSPARKRFKLGQ